MLKIFVSTLCLALLGSQQCQAQAFSIDTFLQHRMKEFHIPALSALVVDNGKVVFQKSYGFAQLEHQVPNTPATAFQLASCTKLLSATAVMTLVQQGKLSLQQKVSAYLPELPAAMADLRVQDLLSHQSGTVDLLGLQRSFTTLQQAYDTALARPLDFAPGTKTVYAGGDYALLMTLVERITGQPFVDFLQNSLFKKLGMRHTAFNNMEQDYIYRTYDVLPYAATVYTWAAGAGQQRIFSMMFPKWTYSAGGLFSSIEDLGKWVVALDKHSLLSAENAEKMWTPTTLRDGSTSPFGLGWIVDKKYGERITGHSGGPALADIMRLPGRKITVIVLTNQMELRPYLSGRVMDLYVQQQEQKKPN